MSCQCATQGSGSSKCPDCGRVFRLGVFDVDFSSEERIDPLTYFASMRNPRIDFKKMDPEFNTALIRALRSVFSSIWIQYHVNAVLPSY